MLVELLRLLQLTTSPASRLLTADTKTRWTSSRGTSSGSCCSRCCRPALRLSPGDGAAGAAHRRWRSGGGPAIAGAPPDGQRRCPPPAQRAASTQLAANFGRQAAAGLPLALLRCWAAVCHPLWRGRPAADAPGAALGWLAPQGIMLCLAAWQWTGNRHRLHAAGDHRHLAALYPVGLQRGTAAAALGRMLLGLACSQGGASGSRQAEVGAPTPLLEHLRVWLDCRLVLGLTYCVARLVP